MNMNNLKIYIILLPSFVKKDITKKKINMLRKL